MKKEENLIMKELIRNYKAEIEKVNNAITDAEIAIADLEVTKAEFLAKQKQAVDNLELEDFESLSNEIERVENSIRLKRESIEKFQTVKEAVIQKYRQPLYDKYIEEVKKAQIESKELEVELFQMLDDFVEKYKQFKEINSKIDAVMNEVNSTIEGTVDSGYSNSQNRSEVSYKLRNLVNEIKFM